MTIFSGGKGGSSSFKQTPDNLRSDDTFEGVLGLCVGPIKGPVRGLKSIKVDGTALENATGQLNFKDFVAEVADGDPLKFPQVVQLKLGAGAAPTQVGVSLPNNNGVPVPQVRTLNNTNANYIDLRFIVNQLFRQDSKGIYNATATLQVRMKPVGSTTWINPTIGTANGNYVETGQTFTGALGTLMKVLIPRSYYNANGTPKAGNPNFPITGKTTGNATVYELRIAVPNEGRYADTAWDIEVSLLERESYTGGKDNADQEQRQISWESMTAVYATQLGTHEDWRGLAWMSLYGKASDQLTGVPEVEGEYDTKIVSVPSSAIYNPTTRTYGNGIWDGSWSKAYTNDPAWVVSDAISDSLSGLSVMAPGSYLNKWDALELSKYCSELVPDGNGGTHPRFSLNLAVLEPQRAEDLIRYLAGAVGALAWDKGDGEWRCKVDKADSPVDLFTLDNVEGEFSYSHTDVDTRYNDIIGKFKNEEMDYREDSVRVFDNASIAKIGRKPTTIVLVGCTNRQEALRRLVLRLRSAVNENRIVNFTTNRRGRNIDQLSTILIADGDLGDRDKQTNGRVIAISADRRSITLRDPIYVAPGIAYTMKFAVVNPNYNPDATTQPTNPDWLKPTIVKSNNVVNTSAQRGVTNVLYLEQALPSDVPELMSIALEATNLPTMPRLFRVTSVSVQDEERISIAAINIDTGKWAASDGASKQNTVFQDLRGAVSTPLPPTDGDILSLISIPVDSGIQVNLVANWLRPASAFLSGFMVRYRINGGEWKILVDRTQQTNVELVNPTAGVYEFEITAMDRRGGKSIPLMATLTVTEDQLSAASDALAAVRESLEKLASDALLSHGQEKRDAKQLFDAETRRYDAAARSFDELNDPSSAQDEYDEATAAITGLRNYLNTLQPSWQNVDVDTPINPTEWLSYWNRVAQATPNLTAALLIQAGKSPYAMLLSNENATLPADKDGNITSYTGADTSLQIFYGATDVTDKFAISGTQGNPQGLTISGTYPNFSVTGGFDASEPAASYTFKVAGKPSTGHEGVTLAKTMSLSKSRVGSDGSSPPLITLTSTTNVAKYDATDTYVGGEIRFNAVRQNIPWTGVFYKIIRVSDGTVLVADSSEGLASSTPNYFGGSGGDTLVMSANAVKDYILAHGTFRVVAYRDGYSVEDSITITKIKDGKAGQNALSAYLTNESYSYVTDAAGQPVNPGAAANGQMKVYDGGTDVTNLATFTVQNPFNQGAVINASGGYSVLYLLGDTGYSYLIATYNGVSIIKTLSGTKVKPGADGRPPALVTVSASPQAIRYDKDNNIISGDVVFRAVRTNTDEATTWSSVVGHGLYGQAGVTINGDTMTITAARIRDVLSYNETYQGITYETIRASVTGSSDTVTVTKVRDGANGSDGTSPIGVELQPGTVNFKAYASGAFYPDQFPYAIGVSITQAGSIVPMSNISVVSATNMTVELNPLRITNVVGNEGYALLDISASGQTVRVQLSATVSRDGADGSAATTLNITTPQLDWTSYTQHGNTLLINASTSGKLTLNLTGAIRGAVSADYVLRFVSKIQYRLAGGAWSDVPGSETTSSEGGIVTIGDGPGSGTRISDARINSNGPYALTGLTPDGGYEIRIVDYRSSAPAGASSRTSLNIYAERTK